jgi:hypothetical protein
MSESTSAIYISMATVLLVWVTIAVYLMQVSSRLRSLKRDLNGGSPGNKPASGTIDAAPDVATETPSVAADQWTWMAWHAALWYGCIDTLRLLDRSRRAPKVVGWRRNTRYQEEFV